MADLQDWRVTLSSSKGDGFAMHASASSRTSNAVAIPLYKALADMASLMLSSSFLTIL